MIDLIRLSDMMAAVAAEVRLARFLVHLSQRMSTSGQSARCLRLQMTRRDIGSYLGVAHETISRSFAALAEAGLIEVEQRKVEILDSMRCSSTRKARARPPRRICALRHPRRGPGTGWPGRLSKRGRAQGLGPDAPADWAFERSAMQSRACWNSVPLSK